MIVFFLEKKVLWKLQIFVLLMFYVFIFAAKTIGSTHFYSCQCTSSCRLETEMYIDVVRLRRLFIVSSQITFVNKNSFQMLCKSIFFLRWNFYSCNEQMWTFKSPQLKTIYCQVFNNVTFSFSCQLPSVFKVTNCFFNLVFLLEFVKQQVKCKIIVENMSIWLLLFFFSDKWICFIIQKKQKILLQSNLDYKYININQK